MKDMERERGRLDGESRASCVYIVIYTSSSVETRLELYRQWNKAGTSSTLEQRAGGLTAFFVWFLSLICFRKKKKELVSDCLGIILGRVSSHY